MAGNRTPPPAAKPSQEWRGVAHRKLRQGWRGTNHTTHQPQPHHTPPPPANPSQEWRETAPRALSQEWRGPPVATGIETQPGVAGSRTQEPPPGVARDQPQPQPHQHTTAAHHTPHTTHHAPRTTAASRPQPGVAGNRTPPQAAKPSQEWRGVAHRNLRQEWRGTKHTTHQPQPHHTPPPPGDLSQEWRGPPTTTGSETQPGVAGSSTREPLPGVARDQPHHTPATTPPTHRHRSPHTTHHTPHTTRHCRRRNPSQEWRGAAQHHRQRNPARSGGE